jgi:NADH-quinone oxidoreductase subunit B
MGSFVTTKIDSLISWARKRSRWIMPCGTDCCGIELMSALVTHEPGSPFTADTMRFTPGQSDVLLVMGTVSSKLAPAIVAAYEAMPEPKRVVAVGACACTGGLYNNYNVVPGCPPDPRALCDSIAKLDACTSEDNGNE